jgi:hypothetical protein
MKTPADINEEINEGIIIEEYEPIHVRLKVKTYLAALDDSDETAAAVYDQARNFAEARHWEFQMKDGDMERVIAVFDAVIDPMIDWLEAKGDDRDDVRRFVFGSIENPLDARAWRM